MITYDFRSFAERYADGTCTPFTIGDYTFQKFPERTREEIRKRTNLYFTIRQITIKQICLIKHIMSIDDLVKLIKDYIMMFNIESFRQLQPHITGVAAGGN